MMKRAAVFASFSKREKVENYVLTYLSELRRVAETVIFVADNALPPAELEKLSGLADFAQTEPHGEYDFGSYKRGLKIARENGVLDCGSAREIQRRLLCRRIKEFLFKKKTTLKGKTLVKICKIPVWAKRVPNEH